MDKRDNYPINIFCSYASDDESLFSELRKHLSLLKRQKAINIWHEGESSFSGDWFREIEQHFQQAQIILLLITSNFIGSSHCSTVMDMALQRHKAGTARVIPVMMSPIALEDAPFKHLVPLPRNGRPVTDKSWSNRDEAFADIVKDIRQSINELQGSLPKQARAQPQQADLKHRQNLLKRMRSDLKDLSLGEPYPVTLRLRAKPSKGETFNWPDRILPDHTKIKTVYEDAGEQLLILGGPGSGKTTLLLQLACNLLEEALEDEANNHIPIMLNLATWEKKDLSFIKWLQNNLHHNYAMPNRVVELWANANKMILLLDGLDDISDKNIRNNCIKAINEYQDKHENLVCMVVTSRPLDPLNPTQSIQLFKTIVVEPLDAKQIDDYIANVSERPHILREALANDPELCELAATPLMLNIMTQVYVEPSVVAHQTANTEKQRRQQVFGAYVKRLLDRKSVRQHYKPPQVEKSLSWIAKQIIQRTQPAFRMEQVDENWLSDISSYTSITLIFAIMVFGVAACLFPLTFLGLLFGWFSVPLIIVVCFFGVGALLGRISWGLSVISVAFLLIPLLLLILFGSHIALIICMIIVMCIWASAFMKKIAWNGTISHSFIALIIFFSIISVEWILALFLGTIHNVAERSSIVFLLLALCVVFVALVALMGRISWGCSMISVAFLLIPLLLLILFGWLISLIIGIAITLFLCASSLIKKYFIDESTSLLFFLVPPLAVLLILLLESILVPFMGTTQNFGMKSFVVFLLFSICVVFPLSFISTLFTFHTSRYRNRLFFMSLAIFLLSMGELFFLPSFALFQNVSCEIVLGITSGIFLFLEVAWLIYSVSRLILRWFLYKEGSIPWNYSHFLNSMVDCNLLRKDNQGYVFIHELLRDYFSSHTP